ncbi:endonuclease/exonuclease/phosphatase family protein [Piscinibacter sp. XHJ-5]|uniref:endonuclease/exonuclease/phosphatase family protein n=1 Tax=Piscinibacter sp. XHJ-5 TaxID=3037797 RepID=UPI0024532065|nr:endonuclease/exonuclease/phosphatase family protein [Piscinibacter sp. XHJ-5]
MKLVTWNIQWGRGVDGRVDLDRIAAHARRFADFDVLCLQEVSAGYPELPGCDGSDQFEALAARFPGFTRIDGVATDTPHPSGGRRRFGNLVLSRLPVRQVFRHLLPWPADSTVPSMQRIALESNLDTPQGPVRVTTTHLEYYSAWQRAAQVERLRELHREACAHAASPRPGTPDEGPFDRVARAAPSLLAGDFNFMPDSPEHVRLMTPIDPTTTSYRDAWECLHPGKPRAPTVALHDRSQFPGPPFTWDFVFVSEDLVPRLRDVQVDAASDASDHQAVMVEWA